MNEKAAQKQLTPPVSRSNPPSHRFPIEPKSLATQFTSHPIIERGLSKNHILRLDRVSVNVAVSFD
jgi:hypothetical protein